MAFVFEIIFAQQVLKICLVNYLETHFQEICQEENIKKRVFRFSTIISAKKWIKHETREILVSKRNSAKKLKPNREPVVSNFHLEFMMMMICVCQEFTTQMDSIGKVMNGLWTQFTLSTSYHCKCINTYLQA